MTRLGGVAQSIWDLVNQAADNAAETERLEAEKAWHRLRAEAQRENNMGAGAGRVWVSSSLPDDKWLEMQQRAMEIQIRQAELSSAHRMCMDQAVNLHRELLEDMMRRL
jgi:hypothetical protein